MSRLERERVLQTNNKYRKEAMDRMKKEDVNTLLLFVLHLLGKLDDYNVISRLQMMLDHNSFLRICKEFGGKTITIPTAQDLRKAVNVLQLYNLVDVQEIDFLQAVLELKPTETEISDYKKLKEVLRKYEFEK